MSKVTIKEQGNMFKTVHCFLNVFFRDLCHLIVPIMVQVIAVQKNSVQAYHSIVIILQLTY